MGEAPDLREQEDCPSPDACAHSCDQHEYGWNDPDLARVEQARCSCGHTALDHAWSGCDEKPCKCRKSGPHVVLASGVVQIIPTGVTTSDERP